MSRCQNDHSENFEALQSMKKEFEQSAAEVQAANMTIIRLQVRKATKDNSFFCALQIRVVLGEKSVAYLLALRFYSVLTHSNTYLFYVSFSF